MKRITIKMIEDGLNQSIIKPCMIDGELAVTIGDYYFFIGCGTDYFDVEYHNIPQDTIVSLINNTLDSFYDDWDCYADEYWYYYYYLCENIEPINERYAFKNYNR